MLMQVFPWVKRQTVWMIREIASKLSEDARIIGLWNIVL